MKSFEVEATRGHLVLSTSSKVEETIWSLTEILDEFNMIEDILVMWKIALTLLKKPVYEKKKKKNQYRNCETKVWLILILMITKQGLELMTTF